MRDITRHQVDGYNVLLAIQAVDVPPVGDAHRRYDITGFDTELNPAAIDDTGFRLCITRLALIFQAGQPIDTANGITNEAVLAVVLDRLMAFQSGPFACDDNRDALAHVDAALGCLHRRTRARQARGVEGIKDP